MPVIEPVLAAVCANAESEANRTESITSKSFFINGPILVPDIELPRKDTAQGLWADAPFRAASKAQHCRKAFVQISVYSHVSCQCH
jgi:hypothetical protein